MHSFEHSLVLERCGHDRLAAALANGSPAAEDCEVVGLRAPGGEAKLVSIGANAAGQSLPGLIEGGTRLASPAVGTGRVPKARAEEGLHGFENLGAHRGGGSVVEVNRWCRWHPTNISGQRIVTSGP